MRIQFFSDIHLEFGALDRELSSEADVIVAAGDVGPGTLGLHWLKGFGKPVIYVAGNHEHYGQDYLSNLETLSRQSSGSNVKFLERQSVVLDEVRFLGCSLWTELGGEENEERDALMKCVNDFRKIKVRGNDLTLSYYSLIHRESRRWLADELERPFDGQTVVITHHAPTPWSWHESPTNPRRYAYCNDLKEFFHNYKIAAWFHGHTHVVSDYRCSGARILCNPRGYFPDQLVADFNLLRTVEI